MLTINYVKITSQLQVTDQPKKAYTGTNQLGETITSAFGFVDACSLFSIPNSMKIVVLPKIWLKNKMTGLTTYSKMRPRRPNIHLCSNIFLGF